MSAMDLWAEARRLAVMAAVNAGVIEEAISVGNSVAVERFSRAASAQAAAAQALIAVAQACPECRGTRSVAVGTFETGPCPLCAGGES